MIPLLAFSAKSGTGKTSLLLKIIPLLRQEGIRPGLIKHTHHDVDVDTPGKDSYRLRKAGAFQTIVANSQRWALMAETPDKDEPDLRYLAGQMDDSTIDIILVEGFKHESVPKILLYRSGTGEPFNERDIDEYTLAIAGDIPVNCPVTVLPLNEPSAVVAFIKKWLDSVRLKHAGL